MSHACNCWVRHHKIENLEEVRYGIARLVRISDLPRNYLVCFTTFSSATSTRNDFMSSKRMTFAPSAALVSWGSAPFFVTTVLGSGFSGLPKRFSGGGQNAFQGWLMVILCLICVVLRAGTWWDLLNLTSSIKFLIRLTQVASTAIDRIIYHTRPVCDSTCELLSNIIRNSNIFITFLILLLLLFI